MNKQQEKEFISEIDEITDTYKAIKGERYCNALYLLLNIMNFYKIVGHMASRNLPEKDYEKLGVIGATIGADSTHRLACLLLGISVGSEDSIERVVEDKMDELRADVDTIMAKQAEYNSRKKEG